LNKIIKKKGIANELAILILSKFKVNRLVYIRMGASTCSIIIVFLLF